MLLHRLLAVDLVRYEHDYLTVGINIGGTSVRQANWATLQVKIDDSLKRAIKAIVNFRTSRVESQWSFWTSVHHRIACRRYATTSSRCFASTRFEQGSRVHDEPAEAPGLESNVALRQGCADHRACSRSSMSCMQVAALVTTSLCRIGLKDVISSSCVHFAIRVDTVCVHCVQGLRRSRLLS